jgi:dTDP-glucose pyrophosphorylase
VIDHVYGAMRLADIEEIAMRVSPRKQGTTYICSGRFGVKLTYFVQDEVSGLANALLAGEYVVEECFSLVLEDNFFHPNSFSSEPIAYLLKYIATPQGAEVDHATRRGIIRKGGAKVANIIEKPLSEVAANRLGTIGIYVFGQNKFVYIRRTTLGHNGEYKIR